MVDSIRIGDRAIGGGSPCFVIAEAGVNHNGSVDLACELAALAKEAGADAVKFQTFSADRIATSDAPKARYQVQATGFGTQVEMLRRLELSAEAHRMICDRCRALGIAFLSTPFDEESADLLDELGVSAFKIASGELTNHPLLRHIASKGKPIILSTGMSRLSEVQSAVAALREGGCAELILLHCVSSYPAAPHQVNLRAMRTLEDAFGVPVGYSDHTLGRDIAVAAVALGANVVEKHVTLDRSLPGPDQQASVEPKELRQLIQSIRVVESALGTGRKEPAPGEAAVAAVVRKSLVAAVGIRPGTVLTKEMIAIKRPGTGLPPELRDVLIGRTARVPIAEGALITMEMLA